MFGSGQPKASNGGAAVDTLIGRQTEVLGDVRFSGGLHIDGCVKGGVASIDNKAAALSVSETGSIEGNVKVPTIVLNGTVTGDVCATERLTLAAKAKVVGNVHYRLLEMESGAAINGKLLHEPGTSEPAALTHQRGRDSTQPKRAPSVSRLEADKA